MIVPASRPPLAPIARSVDVAVVGAGAAGIAAARTVMGAGLTVAVLDARDRIGGRLVTARFGGHPVDLGAHWMHAGDLNPLLRVARARGERLRRAPSGSHLVIDGRTQTLGTRLDHGRAFERADAAFGRVAKGAEDRSIAAAMPLLGRWSGPIATTMALVSGRPLEEVSAQDFPSDEFGDNWFAVGGYGDAVSRLAAGLPIALNSPVRRIVWSGTRVRLEADGGTLEARAAIVTVPTSLVSAITFMPGLPTSTADAIMSFRPGTYEHVILNWPSAPFSGRDRLAKIVQRGRSVGLMTRMDDAPFHYLELDHAIIAATRDRAARARFAHILLREVFGARACRDLRILHVTDWLSDPWSRGSWAVIPPGAAAARAALARPIAERLWFAGEATSHALWGTAGGAWQEGERAARQAVAALANRVAAA